MHPEAARGALRISEVSCYLSLEMSATDGDEPTDD